jgi:hypothetical protein
MRDTSVGFADIVHAMGMLEDMIAGLDDLILSLEEEREAARVAAEDRGVA